MNDIKLIFLENDNHSRFLEKTSRKASEYFTSSIKNLLEKYGFEIIGDIDSYTDYTNTDILILNICSKERRRFRRTILVREF